MNLDTKNWQPFYVADIFNIKSGKGITQEEILENPGDFIAVQSGEGNNGVMGKIDKLYCIQCNYTYTEEPCLTVARSGTAGFVSFQKFGCVVGDSAKILELKNKKHASDEVLLFLQTLLLANRYKFDYGYKVTNDKYSNIILELPVDGSGNPDWQFMKNYIKSLHNKPVTTKNKHLKTAYFDVNDWKNFQLVDLFDIKIAPSSDLGNLEAGSVGFIGRTEFNNGLQGWVSVDNSKIMKKNSITISMVGTNVALWQPNDFTASQNIAVLRCKHLNAYIALFICSLINFEMNLKFNYGRTVNKVDIENMNIKLPSTPEGEPDWQYMEDYIKSLPYGDRI